MIILSKQYDGESIVDMYRDVAEAYNERFTPALATIPRDEHGFHKGTFKVSIVWQDDAEPASAPSDERVLRALDIYYQHTSGAYGYSEALISRMRAALSASQGKEGGEQ